MQVPHALSPSAPHTFAQAQALVETSRLPMIGTQGASHIVRCVNAAFCQCVARPEEAIVGHSLRVPLHNDPQIQDEAALALLDRVYSTGSAEFGVDLAGVVGTVGSARLPLQSGRSWAATGVQMGCSYW